MGFSSIGLPGALIILAVVLLFFGPKKIPEIAESISKGIKKFKDAQNETQPDKKIESSDSNENHSSNSHPSNSQKDS